MLEIREARIRDTRGPVPANVAAMQGMRILFAATSLVLLAACGSGGDTGPRNPADPRPSTTTSEKSPPVVLDPAKVERGIVKEFTQTFAEPEGTLTSASCPDDISGNVGDEMTCDVDFSDGRFGNATIKILDDKGRFEIVGVSRSLGAG